MFLLMEYFLSNQQPSDHVFLLTNYWIGLKFELSVPNILVIDLKGDDRIRRSERSYFRSLLAIRLGGVSFYLPFC